MSPKPPSRAPKPPSLIQLTNELAAPLAGVDKRTAALFAADCAARVLPIFEAARPGDDRPRRAIEAARATTPYAQVRAAASAAHAAARAAGDERATWAARAAGHAVATLHAAGHANAAAAYAVRAAGAPAERAWQLERLHDYEARLR